MNAKNKYAFFVKTYTHQNLNLRPNNKCLSSYYLVIMIFVLTLTIYKKATIDYLVQFLVKCERENPNFYTKKREEKPREEKREKTYGKTYRKIKRK